MRKIGLTSLFVESIGVLRGETRFEERAVGESLTNPQRDQVVASHAEIGFGIGIRLFRCARCWALATRGCQVDLS